jgi:prepilin-type N-terminal cleavage/methylation domain-containing protein
MSLRDERGMTLIELLVSIIVTTIVVGATLTMFIAMTRQNTRENQAVDAESQARISLDRLERELRNMASPGADLTSVSSTLPYSIDRDLPYDLVFQ